MFFPSPGWKSVDYDSHLDPLGRNANRGGNTLPYAPKWMNPRGKRPSRFQWRVKAANGNFTSDAMAARHCA